jgi:two-component system sensor histidine kinase KdpD
VIYGQEKAQQALENFFKESTLSALREMALRQAAHEVDVRQGDSADEKPSAASGSASAPSPRPSRTNAHLTSISPNRPPPPH